MKPIILTIFYILFSFPAIAASLSGTVTDYKTSQPIPNVHIKCSNNDSTHTDNQGYYEFQNLGSGVYDFTFNKTEFEPRTIANVYVGADETLNVKLYPPCLLRIETSSLPPAKKGRAYNTNIELSCTTEPFHFTIVSGDFPPGLSLDPISGNIYGKPTINKNYRFTIGVTDVLDNYADRVFPLTVTDPRSLLMNNYLTRSNGVNISIISMCQGVHLHLTLKSFPAHCHQAWQWHRRLFLYLGYELIYIPG